MIVLRPYQLEAVDSTLRELEKNQSALVVGATGVGKTEVAFATIDRLYKQNPNFKFVFLVNKIKLAKQTADRFRNFSSFIPYSVYCASLKQRELDATVLIASIQSLSSLTVKCDFVILDEVQGVNQDEGRYMTFINRAMKLNPSTKIIAYTATPFRATGYIYGKDKLFKRICFERNLKWSIENGFLVRPLLKYTPEQFDTSKLRIANTGDFVQKDVEKLTKNEIKLKAQLKDALPKLTDRKKIVWACSSIRHCEDVKKELISIGEDAVTVHSKLSRETHDQNLIKFEATSCRHLTFVSEISEGYNYEPIDAIIFMRPTRSPIYMIQCVGRGLRRYDGKSDCVVLDYAGVFERCGTVDNPIIGQKGNKKNAVQVNMKYCPSCYEYLENKMMKCHVCNYEFPVAVKTDYQKNLSTTASYGQVLTEPKFIDIGSVRFINHVSKNKNECLKIDYYPKNILKIPISEYIQKEKMGWLITKRVKSIFGEFVPQFKYINQQFNIDLKITTLKEGKYEKIIGVIRK